LKRTRATVCVWSLHWNSRAPSLTRHTIAVLSDDPVAISVASGLLKQQQ
jgi:hypothetical protein